MKFALLLALVSLASARQPAFDVASLKPSPPSPGDRIDINLGSAQHGEVTLTNTTLSECLQFAYGLSSEDEIAGPAWLRDRELRVDVIAKAPPDTPRDQLLLMLQNLLTERFQMRLHREPRPLHHFELTVDKNGAKLPPAQLSVPGAGSKLRAYGRGHLSYAHVSMQVLTLLLSRQLKEVVIDKTGLSGFYDIDLSWAPENAPETGPPLPDIYTAIREQLGLRLEASKTPIEIIVVDQALKTPIGN